MTEFDTDVFMTSCSLRTLVQGRTGVFERVADFVYVPRDTRVTISGVGRFALPVARCERAWPICGDPAHAWIRSTWEDQAVDPRLPMTGA